MATTVFKIDLGPCINCSLCRRACPTEAILYFSRGRREHVIEPALCIGCDICVQVCPVDCIHPDSEYVIDPAQLELAKEKARGHAHRAHEIKLERKRRATAVVGASHA
jgi:formate hydrogenlyase subunit 6/NADH:ubiquinone oxidoreductase subunit I